MNASIGGTQQLGMYQQLMARLNVGNISTVANAQSGTPAHVGTGSTVLLTPSPSAIPIVSTGGGNNNGGSGGSGNGGSGGSSNGHPPSHSEWPSLQVVAGAFVAVIGAIGLLIYSIRTDPNKVLESQNVANAAIIAEATGAVPPGYTFQGRVQNIAQPLVQQQNIATQVIVPQPFLCRNDEEREAGYAMKNITYIHGRTQSVSFNQSGCYLTVIQGGISKIDGRGYRLDIVTDPNANPPAHRYCGDIAGQPLEECLSFANMYHERELRVVVTDGGYLRFN